MPLTFPSPPADGLAVLQRGLQLIQEAQRLDPRGGGALAISGVSSVMRPYPVYDLGLDDLAMGKGLESARPGVWRYPLLTGNQILHAVEIMEDPGGGSKFGLLTTGFAAGTEQGFAVVEHLPELAQGAYEIRELRALALGVIALWLKDLQGQEDRFIVLPPTFPPPQALTPYSAPELLAILQRKAAHKAPLERQVAPP